MRWVIRGTNKVINQVGRKLPLHSPLPTPSRRFLIQILPEVALSHSSFSEKASHVASAVSSFSVLKFFLLTQTRSLSQIWDLLLPPGLPIQYFSWKAILNIFGFWAAVRSREDFCFQISTSLGGLGVEPQETWVKPKLLKWLLRFQNS